MQKVIVAFGIVMTMLAGAALAEDGAGQAPCGPGKVGCFSAPHSQPPNLKQQDQQSSADSSCRVPGTTWEDSYGGIIVIDTDLKGTYTLPYCKKSHSFDVTLVGDTLSFHAVWTGNKECQGFSETMFVDSSCNVAEGVWENDDGSTGEDTWNRQGIFLSRLDLTRYKASGTPVNRSGKFFWNVKPITGKPPKYNFDIGNDVHYINTDNPNGAILTDPKNKGEPTPGGLFLLQGTFAWKIGKITYKDIDSMVGATFGMSCYNTALESDWGTPPSNCMSATIDKNPYAGAYTQERMLNQYCLDTKRSYCASFIESVRIEGFGKFADPNAEGHKYIGYDKTTKCMFFRDDYPVGDHKNKLEPGISVARDKAIIPVADTLINVNWVGREPGQAGIGLKAADSGSYIQGYRLDWYGGEGRYACDLPPPTGKKKPVGFKNPITIGACTPEQVDVFGHVTCPSDTPTTSSQRWLTESGFLLSPPFKHADSRTALADSGASAVFVKNNEIVISTEATEQIQLTHNGIPKSFPVWSKDGSKIAFIENTSRNTALSRLRVIGRDGTPVFSFLIHPVPSDPLVTVFGMRFVERVEWVTDSRIAVSGSINPSTCENIVFDLSAGIISDDFFDDGGSAYSPDGLHIAYITGAPHFSSESSRERELIVDGRRVFPERGTQVKFITDPKWNKDSQTLAIVATEDKTKTSNIVMCRPKGEPSVIPFSMEEEAFHHGKADLFWNGQDLVLTSGQQAWSVSQGSLEGINLTLAVDPKQDATKIKRELAASLPAHAEQPDFWCQSCALSLLKRRSSVYDE